MMTSSMIPVQPLEEEQPLSSLLSAEMEEGSSSEPFKLSDNLFVGSSSIIIEQSSSSNGRSSSENITSSIEEGDATVHNKDSAVEAAQDKDEEEGRAGHHHPTAVVEQDIRESSSPLDRSDSTSSSSSSSISSSDATPTSTANSNPTSTPSDTSSSPNLPNTPQPPVVAPHQPSIPAAAAPLAANHTNPAKEQHTPTSRLNKRNSFFTSLSALFSSRRTKKESSLSSLGESNNKAATKQTSFVSSTVGNSDSNSNMKTNSMSPVPSPPSLFSPSLISPEVQSQLPEGYRMRPLEMTDYEKGFYDCLAGLTVVGEVSAETFRSCFDNMSRAAGVYNTVVIEDLAQARIVATGTLIVEQKFIRGGGKAGHIEDIVVHDSQRGKKFGIRLIDQLKYLGQQLGCYKLLLTCSEANEPFYEKSAFARKDLHMALYLSLSSSSSTAPSAPVSVPVPVPVPVPAAPSTAAVEVLSSSSSCSSSSSSSSSSASASSAMASHNSSSTDVATLPTLTASSCKLDIALGASGTVVSETTKEISILSVEPEVERSTSLAVH